MFNKILLFGALALTLAGCNNQKELSPAPRFHLDTRFEVQVQLAGEKDFLARQERNLEAAFDKIVELDSLLNKLSPLSEISALNSNAGLRLMELNRLTYDLLEKSLNASVFTDGYFDIAWYPLIKLFETSSPTAERIAKAKAASGYQNVALDAGLRRVRYSNNATEVDFDHIKRGFALDLLANSLKGVVDGQIKAGNLTYYFGTRRVPVKSGDRQVLALRVSNAAVAVLNPAADKYYSVSAPWRRYLPVKSPLEKIEQVIVMAPNAVTAEVLANAFYFMGTEKALQKIEEIKSQASSAYEVYFVILKDGEPQVISSADKN